MVKWFYLDFSSPVVMEAGADLMLLHPDGSEELLVAGGDGSITDPVVSFDGEWVYYVHIYQLRDANQWTPPAEGADIFKIHLPTRKIVRLTNQQFSPNTGAANWTADFRRDPQAPHDDTRTHFHTGVYNMGPFPLPGGKLVFTSNRDGFRPAKGYPAIACLALHLHVSGAAELAGVEAVRPPFGWLYERRSSFTGRAWRSRDARAGR